MAMPLLAVREAVGLFKDRGKPARSPPGSIRSPRPSWTMTATRQGRLREGVRLERQLLGRKEPEP